MPRKPKRLDVSHSLDHVGVHGRSLTSAIEQLQAFNKIFQDDYEKLWIEHDEYELQIVGTRKENDTEYNRRINKHKKQKEKKEQNERKQYEKLKKKFEK